MLKHDFWNQIDFKSIALFNKEQNEVNELSQVNICTPIEDKIEWFPRKSI